MTTRRFLCARWRTWWAAARRFLGQWAWTPILRRALVWLGAFVALAHVGTGAAARLVGAPDAPGSGWALPTAHGADPPPRSAAGLASVPGHRAPPPVAAASSRDGGVDRPALTADGKVILNLASVTDLVRLPGIGQKRGQAIVELRKRLGGRFRRVRDLLRIRGIGYRTMKRIEPLVVLDPPPQPDGGR
ncbi:MAG: helix-hairpin-helix domain-containing protein [Deltaproteobacteria bacterium]|nr:helix-hairpin-helix domain-containing protein [Deltaproteobacteria bacterium]